eukprot:Nitzschia sp. Nitz4//scaffold136_size62208//28460//29452//NITZ4_006369-RA/size62208-processed-gene-0.37-mRNA-1//-1//CDS//3329535621//2076//frame0
MTNNNDSNTASKSQDHENPWESAANDVLWTAQHDVSNNNNNNHNRNNWNPQEDDEANNHICFFQWFQACHWLDILMSSTVMILYLSGVASFSKLTLTHMFWWSLSALWMARGLLAKLFKVGVPLSATMSAILAVFYTLSALINWFWLHCLVWETVCQKHPHLQSILMLVFGFLEAIRFLSIRHWMILEQERWNTQDAMGGSPRSRTFSRSSGPWWWASPAPQHPSSTDQAHDPLLSPSTPTNTGSTSRRRTLFLPPWTSNQRTYVEDHDAPAGSTGGWWPFSSPSRRSRDADADDASVEYASLNEDWASRSEEDPFWWAHEQQQQQQQQS